ncbi:hypothetical protein BH23PLA1_BH23PLA1_23270 [soil metagenome]
MRFMRTLIRFGPGFLAVALTVPALGQFDDLGDLEVDRPVDKQDVEPTPPPEGAIVLFDGQSLDAWVQPNGSEPAWKLVEGNAAQVQGGSLRTRDEFDGHFKVHVEFRTPYQPEKQGQARGNSGVYVQGRYEVQILDSYGIEKPGPNDCGAIYEVSAPRVNACKAPTVWQSYDIEFHAPRFEDGQKITLARMTVHQNGVLIQDNVEIPMDNTRAGLGGDPSQPGPIYLQDHGDPVQFRNIWLLPMN